MSFEINVENFKLTKNLAKTQEGKIVCKIFSA